MQSHSIPKIISSRTSSKKSTIKLGKIKIERRSIKIKRILQDFTDRYSSKKKNAPPCSNIPQYLKRSAKQLHKYFNSTEFMYMHQRDITEIRHNADLLQKQSYIQTDRQSKNEKKQVIKQKNNPLSCRNTNNNEQIKCKNYARSQKWQSQSIQEQINWELLQKLENKIANWST